MVGGTIRLPKPRNGGRRNKMDSRDKQRVINKFRKTLERLEKAQAIVDSIKEDVYEGEKELYEANIDIGRTYRDFYEDRLKKARNEHSKL
jgi:hypothetical protein